MASKSDFAMGVVQQILDAAKPASVVAGAASVGAAAAQIGGELVKIWPPARAFATKSAYHEAGVDLVGGIALDVPILLGAGVVWGKKGAKELAPFLVGGTFLSAAAPIAAPYLSRVIQATTSTVVNMLPGATPGGRKQLSGRTPGGQMTAGAKDLW